MIYHSYLTVTYIRLCNLFENPGFRTEQQYDVQHSQFARNELNKPPRL